MLLRPYKVHRKLNLCLGNQINSPRDKMWLFLKKKQLKMIYLKLKLMHKQVNFRSENVTLFYACTGNHCVKYLCKTGAETKHITQI